MHMLKFVLAGNSNLVQVFKKADIFTGHGRFHAETVKNHPNKPDCYISTLRINGAHHDDSHNYELRLSNQHGVDTHTIQLAVKGDLL